MNYLTNYYINLSEQLQERVNYLKKLLSESVVTSREMNYTDYEKVLDSLKAKGAPASQIADWEAEMVEAGARHGLDLTKPAPSAAREMNYTDYQRAISHLKSKGAPASQIADWEAEMVEAGARHGLDLKPQAPSTEIPSTTARSVGRAAGNAAKGIGAGIVGNLVGQYLVKPAAEKAGVFNGVEKGSRAAFSRMPDWAVDAADKSLGAAQGAAQVALDPIGSAFTASVDTRTKQQDRMRKSGMSEDEIAQSMASSIQ